MPLMLWSKHFETGIDQVDAQHRQLVELINGVAPHLADTDEAPAVLVAELLAQLAQYAVMHFQSEESLMQRAGIDAGYFGEHQALHKAFADEVTQMIQATEKKVPLSGSQLLRFLTAWLTFHILSEDQNMARQLRDIENGVNPGAAAATINRHDNSANAVLNEALIDLFSLITQRNQKLQSLNEALAFAKAELATSNEQLEERVQVRTSQLETANEELEHERKALIESLAQVKTTQTQLVQAEKMAAIGQLAAGVAHEINNPIGFVTANLNSLGKYTTQLIDLVDTYEKLLAQLSSDTTVGEAIRRARAIAELDYLRQDVPGLLEETAQGLARVKRIVVNLRDFATIDDGPWQQADINHVLESTLDMLANQFGERIVVRREFGTLPSICCLPAQINLVFMNLLLNAAQAIENTGIITARTRSNKDAVQIDISDTGKGIAENLLHRIFEPFFTTKRIGEGTGLGLSMSWEIVRQHGGLIAAQSSPGKGSTFTVTLPIKPKLASTGSQAK